MSSNSLDITVVLTSCGRMDLLHRTLESFHHFNTASIARIVVIEDSADPACRSYIEEHLSQYIDLFLFNEHKLGQIRSVDKAYSHVDTPLIFHCEDDFVFYRPGFIEDSLDVLAAEPRIITVWLNELWDVNRHQLERRIRTTSTGVMYRKILPKEAKNGWWYGFSFRPGLRRTSDYERVKPFASIGHEHEINLKYHELGFFAAVLELGAVEHIGANRRVDKNIHRRRRLRRPFEKLFGLPAK